MFQLQLFPKIKSHLKTISTLYIPTSNNTWIQIFCPYCNDSTRKYNPKHGHCYIATTFPYFLCFRCNESGSLLKLLLDTGFTDTDTIQSLKSISSCNIKYSYHKELFFNENNTSKVINIHEQFKAKWPDKYNQFLRYIYTRCLHINPIQYSLTPILYNNKLGVKFQNYNLESCGIRFINTTSNRYLYPENRHYYYFQDITNIINYHNIVISEGAFDLINLHHYNKQFNNRNTFFIAVGGSSFERCIKHILSNFLVIGNYNLHIIFDNNFEYFRKTIFKCNRIVKSLNHNVNLKFYKPIAGKDISDCNAIQLL